jgi:hypothetical protein
VAIRNVGEVVAEAPTGSMLADVVRIFGHNRQRNVLIESAGGTPLVVTGPAIDRPRPDVQMVVAERLSPGVTIMGVSE